MRSLGLLKTPAPTPSRPEIADFLERARALGPAATAGARGRLVFALDATMSRQPTWDMACALQADMFREAAVTRRPRYSPRLFPRPRRVPGHGLGFRQRATGPADVGDRLPRRQHPDRQGLAGCAPRGGRQQPCRRWSSSATPWRNARRSLRQGRRARPARGAGVHVPGRRRPADGDAFREIARLTHGAYCRFDTGAAHELRELLRAVAAYAAGGIKALADLSDGRPAARVCCWRN